MLLDLVGALARADILEPFQQSGTDGVEIADNGSRIFHLLARWSNCQRLRN